MSKRFFATFLFALALFCIIFAQWHQKRFESAFKCAIFSLSSCCFQHWMVWCLDSRMNRTLLLWLKQRATMPGTAGGLRNLENSSVAAICMAETMGTLNNYQLDQNARKQVGRVNEYLPTNCVKSAEYQIIIYRCLWFDIRLISTSKRAAQPIKLETKHAFSQEERRKSWA